MTAELRALLALLLIGGLGWAGYQVLFSDSTVVDVVLYDVHGNVLVESGGAKSTAAVGAHIGASDRLVSGDDGSAILGFGADSRVTLAPNTSVQVTSVDATGVKLSLENGRVKATVRSGGPGLGVTAGGRTVTASDADFSVARTVDGVGVETSRGRVEVDGDGLDAGERVIFPGDGTPLQLPAAEELLLQMVWPAEKRTASSQVHVTGRTEPGARLHATTSASAADARSAADGSFAFDIGIAEGENTVAVQAVNVFGQISKAEWEVSRDSMPPSIGVRIP